MLCGISRLGSAAPSGHRTAQCREALLHQSISARAVGMNACLSDFGLRVSHCTCAACSSIGAWLHLCSAASSETLRLRRLQSRTTLLTATHDSNSEIKLWDATLRSARPSEVTAATVWPVLTRASHSIVCCSAAPTGHLYRTLNERMNLSRPHPLGCVALHCIALLRSTVRRHCVELHSRHRAALHSRIAVRCGAVWLNRT